MGKTVDHQEVATATLNDPIAAAARQYAAGVEQMRVDMAALTTSNAELQTQCAMLETEVSCLRAQLSEEKAERGYYQRFTVEVVTLLNIVGVAVDEVVNKARQAAYRKNGAAPTELPELKLPEFLQKGPRKDEETAAEVAA